MSAPTPLIIGSPSGGGPVGDGAGRNLAANQRGRNTMIDAIVQPWRADAACAGQDPAIWYPERGQTVDAAVAICAGCPVRAECAEYGLSLGAAEPGVWGGLSWRERRQILRGQTPSVRRPRRPAECGTPAGYTRHRKAGEAACGECRAAVAAYQRERSRRLREEWAS